MIPQELIQQIRQIQIFTNRTANEVFAGEYESTFKGQGMQFDEVREYMAGDDIRSIDWNVTARMNKPFIKRYVEEREMTVVFMVDLSASGVFGTVDKLKNKLAAELCAVLAFSAIKNNDKVGLITFTDRIERYIPPGKGTQHVLRIIRELLYHDVGHRQTDLAMALDHLGKVIRKKATVFLVSDFIGPDVQPALRVINKRHDLIAVAVGDEAEKELPKVGLIEFEDAETGQVVLVDSSSRRFRQRYENVTAVGRERVGKMFQGAKVDCINVSTGKAYVPELIRFFYMREKRR
jgi:uncharacterized protein (DUF58 family)